MFVTKKGLLANSPTFKLFVLSCCLERYKLVRLSTTKRFQEISACREACYKHGMELMPLNSDRDREAIVSLPQYNGNWLVITDGIEIVGESGDQQFFSKPGGKQVDFIRLASKIGLRQSNTPGTYTIVIYHREYYSRDSVVDKNDACACKVPGEWCL